MARADAPSVQVAEETPALRAMKPEREGAGPSRLHLDGVEGRAGESIAATLQGRATAEGVMRLQRLAGNAAVTSLLSPPRRVRRRRRRSLSVQRLSVTDEYGTREIADPELEKAPEEEDAGGETAGAESETETAEADTDTAEEGAEGAEAEGAETEGAEETPESPEDAAEAIEEGAEALSDDVGESEGAEAESEGAGAEAAVPEELADLEKTVAEGDIEAAGEAVTLEAGDVAAMGSEMTGAETTAAGATAGGEELEAPETEGVETGLAGAGLAGAGLSGTEIAGAMGAGVGGALGTAGGAGAAAGGALASELGSDVGEGLSGAMGGGEAAPDMATGGAAGATGGDLGAGLGMEGLGMEGLEAESLEDEDLGGMQRSALPGAGGLAVQRLAGAPEIPTEIPETPDVALPEQQPEGEIAGAAAGIQGAAGEVQAAGQGGGGGGILDAIRDRAMSLFRGAVSGITSVVSGGVTAVPGMLREKAGAAFGGIREAAGGLKETVVGGVNGAKQGLSGAFASVKQLATGVAGDAMGRAKGLLKTLTAPITSAVRDALKGDGDIVGKISGVVSGAITGVVDFIRNIPTQLRSMVTQALDAAVGAVTGVVDSIEGKIQGVVAAAGEKAQELITSIQGIVDRIKVSAESRTGGIGGALRRFVAGMINRVLSVVRSIATRILDMARSVVSTIQSLIQTIVGAIRTALLGLINLGRMMLETAAHGVINAAEAFVRFHINLITGAINGFQTMLSALIGPLVRRAGQFLVDRIVAYLQPYIDEALAAAAASPRGLPPGTSPEAVRDAAQEASTQIKRDVLTGILSPEGDHIAVGYSGSAGGQIPIGGVVGAGGGGGIGGTLDFFTRYRPKGRIAVFITPQAYLSATGGLGGGGNASINKHFNWGTVLTYGAPKDQNYRIQDSVGGWGYGIGVGGQVGLGKGARAAVSGGHTLYTNATRDVRAPSPPVQPPGPEPRPQPRERETVSLGSGSVQFGNQSDTVNPDPHPQLESLAGPVGAMHASDPSATFAVDAVGHASPRWRAARTPEEADRNNAGLADRRGANTKRAMEGALGRLAPEAPANVRGRGLGSRAALDAGADRNNNDPRWWRADVEVAATRDRPAPQGPGPQGPGPQGPGQGAGQGPGGQNPGIEEGANTIPRPAWGPDAIPGQGMIGWDTNLTVSVGAGVEASLGGYATGTVSYSIPVHEWELGPAGTIAARIVFFLVKMGFNLMTGSVLGAIRDGVGFVVPMIEEVTGTEIVQPIVDWALPLPAGQ